MHYKDIIGIVKLILDFVSIAILIIGVIRALIQFGKNELISEPSTKRAAHITEIKNFFASYVLFSLEVLIAADIIETIMNPTPEDVMILGAIVVIRTVISYFLGKEVEEAKQES